MCLVIPNPATTLPALTDEDYIAYKILRRLIFSGGKGYRTRLCTPVIQTKVSINFKASGKSKYTHYKMGLDDDVFALEGGAIHCYRRPLPIGDVKLASLWKVKGKKVMAYNHSEIAFDEIEFIERVA